MVGAIPITLQTFAVFICSLILGWKASIVFFVYAALGLVGLPVFSSGGGFAYVYSPTFGFIISFIPASIIIGLGSKSDKKYLKYVTSLCGLLLINIIGVAYMYFIFNFYMDTNKSILAIIQIGVLPFILKDVAVAIVSCIIYSRIKIVLDRNE
ncbi:MAG: biotin transporter BioY [Bacilli bacterium]|nr:biotin transporter BioY [Bacilli bacterium]